jgi:predicted nucleotidyltransferase
MRERDIIQKTVDVLCRNLHPDEIWLFGSRAKGTAVKGADFDFAVSGACPDATMSRKIAEELEDCLGLHLADIVYLGSVKEDFREIVYTTGRKVYERVSGCASKV